MSFYTFTVDPMMHIHMHLHIYSMIQVAYYNPYQVTILV